MIYFGTATTAIIVGKKAGHVTERPDYVEITTILNNQNAISIEMLIAIANRTMSSFMPQNTCMNWSRIRSIRCLGATVPSNVVDRQIVVSVK